MAVKKKNKIDAADIYCSNNQKYKTYLFSYKAFVLIWTLSIYVQTEWYRNYLVEYKLMIPEMLI